MMLEKYVHAVESSFPLLRDLRSLANKSSSNSSTRNRIEITDPEELVQGVKGRKIAVVHGPPGCGKTFTGVTLALSHCAEGSTVLFLAKRNNCVEDFLVKCIKRSSSDGNGILNPSNIMRLGKCRTSDEEMQKYYFDEKLIKWKRKPNRRKKSIGGRKGPPHYRKLKKAEKMLSINNSTVRKNLQIRASEIVKPNTENSSPKSNAKITTIKEGGFSGPQLYVTDFQQVDITPDLSKAFEVLDPLVNMTIGASVEDEVEDANAAFAAQLYFSTLSNLETFVSENTSSTESLHNPSVSRVSTLSEIPSRHESERRSVADEIEEEFAFLFSDDDEDDKTRMTEGDIDEESICSSSSSLRENEVSYKFCDLPLNFRPPPFHSRLFRKDSVDMSNDEKKDFVFTKLRERFDTLKTKAIEEYQRGTYNRRRYLTISLVQLSLRLLINLSNKLENREGLIKIVSYIFDLSSKRV